MKAKPFSFIAAVFVIICAIIWWLMRSPSTSQKVQFRMLTPTAAPSRIEKTATPAIPLRSETASASPTAVEVAPPSADPQSDLKTVIPDIARLLRAGDLLAFRQTYTPPGELDYQLLQRIQAFQEQEQKMAGQDPAALESLQKVREAAAQAYEALRDQTPTYNAARTEATYIYTLPSPTLLANGPVLVPVQGESKVRKTFVKIDGKWYLKPDKTN